MPLARRYRGEEGTQPIWRTNKARCAVLTRRKALAYSASRTSKLVQHLHSIFVSTYGVLFLGTPHNGSSKAGLASVGSRMISALTPSKVVDTNSQLTDTLREGSEVLQNITDMFVPLMKNFRIYFFWEQEKTNLGTTLAYVCLFVRARQHITSR